MVVGSKKVELPYIKSIAEKLCLNPPRAYIPYSLKVLRLKISQILQVRPLPSKTTTIKEAIARCGWKLDHENCICEKFAFEQNWQTHETLIYLSKILGHMVSDAILAVVPPDHPY